MPTNLTEWSAVRIACQVAGGKTRAEEVVQAFLARIKREDPKIGAFVTVMETEALEAARAVDRGIAAGRPAGKLAGVPVAIKDNMMVSGAETTCSSKILKGYRAPYDATVIERLRAAGAIIIGKTNMDEFAMGSSTENSAFFKTRNPWNLECVPGGSSGGSAAAVAARFAPLALGSDTGGSIRQPAALCGVVGIKPTYGLVSRYGLIAFASSLDQIGPMARTVGDASLALSVIAGWDPRDSTSYVPDSFAGGNGAPNGASGHPSSDGGKGYDYVSSLDGGISSLRIGVPREYFIDGMDPEVEKAVRAGLDVFKRLGCSVEEVSLPHTRYAVSIYYLLATAEASSNLARFDGVRYGHSILRDAQGAKRAKDANLLEVYERSRGEGFGPEVKRRIMLGTYALSSGYYDAYYNKAQRVCTLIRRDFDNAFRSVDVLLTPTSPSAAFKFGEKSADPLQMYLSDIFTIPCNLAGICGVSIPCGLTSNGLPVGLQLMAKPFREASVLQMCRSLESTRPFPQLKEIADGAGSRG